jgi:hypothetical protein
MALRPLRSVPLKWLVTALAIALLAAWVAGRWYSASLAIGRTSIGESKGCLYFNHDKGLVDPDWRALNIGLNGPPFTWAWWGTATDDRRYRGASIPLWIPAIPALFVAGALWRPDVQAIFRRRAGRCPTCGYDRHGLGPAPCPECGTTPEASAATTL